MNERGLTLIEILAAITILSIIGVIIWNVLFQGLDFSKKAISKNLMQQEANLIVTKLTKIHQTSNTYKLESNSCKITVSYTKQDNTMGSEEFSNSKMCLSTNFTGEVEPSNTDLPLEVTIYDPNYIENNIVVDSLLYRLKGGGN